jgi:DNA-binding transcriptional LysR family regulator
VKLFDRIGRQTVLTPAGQDLLGRGRSLLHDADLIRSRAQEIAGGSYGVLRLGATPQSIESFVAQLLARYRLLVPNAEINILEDGLPTRPGFVIQHEEGSSPILRRQRIRAPCADNRN